MKGKIIQHIVTQELMAQHDSPSYKPHFWVRENANSQAEVDLLHPHKQYVIPIEVKSGESGTLRSLHQFIDACGHPYAIRLLANQFSIASTHPKRHTVLADEPTLLFGHKNPGLRGALYNFRVR